MPLLLGIRKPYYNQVLGSRRFHRRVDRLKHTCLSGPTEYWKMYFDGSLNIDGAGAGVLFVSPSKEQLRYVLRIYFPASNIAAEYEACLHGLRIAVELGVKRLYVYGDSTLVINQLNKD